MGILGKLLGAKELVPMSMDGVINCHRELIRSIMAGEMNTEYFQKKWPGFRLLDEDGRAVTYEDIKVCYHLNASHGDAENNIYDEFDEPYPLGELVNAHRRSTEKGRHPMTDTQWVTISANCRLVPSDPDSLDEVMQKPGVAELTQ